MTDTIYLIVSVLLTVGVLIGISLLSRVKTAVYGNMLSVLCTAGAIVVTMYKYGILTFVELWISMIAGLVIGLIWAYRIKMIQMPQVVAFLNGLGGAAAASIAIVTLLDIYTLDFFALFTAALALTIGMITLTGSMVAAGKLHKLLPQKPIIWKYHQGIGYGFSHISNHKYYTDLYTKRITTNKCNICLLISGFGIAFTVRVGGADMPITYHSSLFSE